jgi:hypothetical protein
MLTVEAGSVGSSELFEPPVDAPIEPCMFIDADVVNDLSLIFIVDKQYTDDDNQ